MAQILDPLPSERSGKVLCCYVNATNQIQVARITNIPNWYFERVVFPGQRLMFEAVSDGLLEIHTGMMASAILSDRIPCDRLALQVIEDVKKNYSAESEVGTLKEYKSSGNSTKSSSSSEKVLAAVD
jgi:hypothetical protein